jgi:hypothetical protein
MVMFYRFLWVWFLVPLGLPILSLGQSIGVAMVVGWLTYQSSSTQTKKEDNGLVLLFTNFIFRPLAVLGVGYIVKQFI